MLQADTSGHCPTPGYRCVPKTVQHILPWAIWPSRDAWMPICRCLVVKATARSSASGLGQWLLDFQRGQQLVTAREIHIKVHSLLRLLDPSRNCYAWAHSCRFCKCLWLAACPCCGGDLLDAHLMRCYKLPMTSFISTFP